MRRDKFKLTELLIKQLPDDRAMSFDEAKNSWWYNLRRNGGMRLTTAGHECFSKILDIEHYDIDIDPKRFDRRTLLALDRKLDNPYYIVVSKGLAKKIVLYSSQDAVVALLYGDVKRWLDSL